MQKVKLNNSRSIVNKDEINSGILRQITINDLMVGRSVEEVLRLVNAFQFTDAHGEVCPMGWSPGQTSIKPTVKDSKNYFEKVKYKTGKQKTKTGCPIL